MTSSCVLPVVITVLVLFVVPEINLLLVVLFALDRLATQAGSQAVLPARSPPPTASPA
jgi:hypothetical protein